MPVPSQVREVNCGWYAHTLKVLLVLEQSISVSGEHAHGIQRTGQVSSSLYDASLYPSTPMAIFTIPLISLKLLTWGAPEFC